MDGSALAGRTAGWRSLVLVALCPLGAASARAQEKEAEPPGWSGSTELSVVSTSGNAEGTTFGLNGRLTRSWKRKELVLKLSGLRAESTVVSRVARGTPGDFRVEETRSSATTAEKYAAGLAYRRALSERLHWYVNGGWDRNEFAGIRNRYLLSAGIGHDWWENDGGHLRSGYGGSFTRQQDVITDPGRAEAFAGLRLNLDFSRELTGTTTFDTLFVVDQSLDQTRNFRFDSSTSVAVAMSQRLAFKVSLQLLFDNDPALVQVPLIDDEGRPTGESALVPAEKLDTLLNLALVLDF